MATSHHTGGQTVAVRMLPFALDLNGTPVTPQVHEAFGRPRPAALLGLLPAGRRSEITGRTIPHGSASFAAGGQSWSVAICSRQDLDGPFAVEFWSALPPSDRQRLAAFFQAQALPDEGPQLQQVRPSAAQLQALQAAASAF